VGGGGVSGMAGVKIFDNENIHSVLVLFMETLVFFFPPHLPIT